MGQSEQHDIVELFRRLTRLEAKVYGGNHFVDDNKKVELKLNEEWNKEIEKDRVHNGWDYLMGVEDMQNAIYDRALEIFKRKCRHNNGDTGMKGIKEQIWKEAKQDSFDEAMNGDLKPPQ